jgi:hypothetical protein
MTKKRSRDPFDDIFRPLLFAACGGRCCDCGKDPVECGPLQLGHIWRHEDDGPDTLENFQPLCAECNGRHDKEMTMTDLRPTYWRDRFVKLVAGALQTELRVAMPPPVLRHGTDTLEPIQATESKVVIPWESAEFALNISLSRTISGDGVPTLDQMTWLVDLAIKKFADHKAAPIPPPEERLKNKLIQKVRQHGWREFQAGRHGILSTRKMV